MAEVREIKNDNIPLFWDLQNYSRLCSETFVYSWTISKFSSCLDFSSVLVCSPDFNFKNTSWRLVLQASSRGGKLNKIKIRLRKSEKDDNGYFVKYKISLFDDDGFIATKEEKSNFEGDYVVGPRVIFSYQDQKKVWNGILQKDKLNISCELLVLTAVTCKSPDKSSHVVPKFTNSSQYAKKLDDLILKENKATCKGNIFPNIKRSKPIAHAYKKKPRDELDFWLALALLIAAFVMIFGLANKNSGDAEHTREINHLIIDTTLKVINIADALNLTEVKSKSLNLLSSLQKKYNISDAKFPQVNLSDILQLQQNVPKYKNGFSSNINTSIRPVSTT